jgi:hypothetical protein
MWAALSTDPSVRDYRAGLQAEFPPGVRVLKRTFEIGVALWHGGGHRVTMRFISSQLR